ncbi:ribonuclease H-like protein [Xylaria digitata]|nr:ribonuclease H-like protein [Xylaria digitata]
MTAASSSNTSHVAVPENGLEAFEHLTLNETHEETNGIINNAAAIAAMVDELHGLPVSPPSLYIDLEGVNLSRHGTISILQIHVRTTGQNYLVDVKTLGEVVFLTRGIHTCTTLKDILESPSILKVFFDVRNDSDALYSHYRIELQGIQDLQLMELATRTYRRTFVTGLKKCIERDMPMTTLRPEKGGSYEVFNERPLPEKIRMYCVQDVHFLPRLWDLYSRKLSPKWKTKVEEATKARVVQSQAPNFNGTERHMTLAPEGWGRR